MKTGYCLDANIFMTAWYVRYAEQRQPPAKKSNYKIPLICTEENVDCINFISMLENLEIRI